MLLCIFASPRSSQAQIDRLIRYLEDKRERHRDDPESTQLIEALLARAHQWIAPLDTEYRPERSPHEDGRSHAALGR